MATKTDRVEARLSPQDRERIERAASTVGLSVSGFLVGAAVDRADEVIATASSTRASSTFFDDLVAALDAPDPAPRLSAAAERARRTPRIKGS